MPGIRIHDGPDEVPHWLLQLGGPRVVSDLDAVTLAPDKAGLPKYLDVLGQGRPRNDALARVRQCRARAAGTHALDLREDRCALRVAKGVQDRVWSYVLDGGMGRLAHAISINGLDSEFNNPEILNNGINELIRTGTRCSPF